MGEWIRFAATAGLLILALLSFASAVIGAYRFGFVMNRMHGAGIGDTLGLFCVIAALVISSENIMDALKLILLIVFMWFTSPVSTHFLGQFEYFTNPHVFDKISHFVIRGNQADASVTRGQVSRIHRKSSESRGTGEEAADRLSGTEGGESSGRAAGQSAGTEGERK